MLNKSHNFSEKALKLVTSYFEIGEAVKLKDAISCLREIKKACRQGYCSGPLLWNIFQSNALYYTVSGCQMLMHADGYQLYTSNMDAKGVELTLNVQARLASQWCKENSLLANKDKFLTMTLNANKVEVMSAADRTHSSYETLGYYYR